MALQIPLVSVNVGAVSMEAFLYGVYLVLFVASMYLLATHYARSQPRVGRDTSTLKTPVFLGPICLFMMITAHWIMTVDRSFLAFVYFKNGSIPIEFYGDLSQTTEVVKTGFISAALVIGDSLIIHRLWVVSSHNKYIVIFPICTLLGLAICGGGITYQLSQYKPDDNVFLTAAGRWITSDTVFTLCTNVYCTAMIAWRLWRNSRFISPHAGRQNLNSLLVILIESAALYTTWTLFYLIAYQTGSNLEFIVLDCWPAVSGISCTLIQVRVGLGWSQRTNPPTAGSVNTPFTVSIRRDVHTSPSYQMEDFGPGRANKVSANNV